MGWATLPKRSGRFASDGVYAAITRTKDHREPVLRITMTAPIIEDLGWTGPGCGVRVLTGTDEHAGLLRLVRDDADGRSIRERARKVAAFYVPLWPDILPTLQERQKLETRVDGGALEIAIPPAWRALSAATAGKRKRRLRATPPKGDARAGDTPPPAPASDLPARRECLKCGKDFDSTGVGNRLCGPCRAIVQNAGPDDHHTIAR